MVKIDFMEVYTFNHIGGGGKLSHGTQKLDKSVCVLTIITHNAFIKQIFLFDFALVMTNT